MTYPTSADLARLAEEWRAAEDGERRFVPAFDPRGAGTTARIVVLTERPAAVTVAQGASATCGEDSASRAVQALVSFREEAGLRRRDYLRWNIVPWADLGKSVSRPPTRANLDEARPALHALLTHLPEVRVIVTLGQPALDGFMRYLTLHADPVVRPVLAAPHPSPANGAHRAEQRIRIVNALRQAAILSQT